MSENYRELVDQARRSFLLKSGAGLGALSLLDLFGGSAIAQQSAPQDFGVLAAPHHTPRAKRVVMLHMLGAMSHVDTFDYKPMLERMHGEEIPPSVRDTQRISTMSAGQSAFPIVRPLGNFAQHGESGAWVSDLLPYTSEIVDDLCFIKSMHTEHVNHDPASKFLHSGYQLAGRPSGGAWLSYALGTDNHNLPTYVVLNSGPSGGVPQDSAVWGAGFLPSHNQGVEFRAAEDPVLYVGNPDGIESDDRRQMLDALQQLSRTQYEATNDSDILSRVSQYEMAYRMQESVPEIADISDEPDYVLDMYGPSVFEPGTYARNCIIARRLLERDVKFVTHFGMGWDHHLSISTGLPVRCRMVDQASAALVKDLKQRGLLDDTLVMFGSEFGRSPFIQGNINDSNFGRDHHGGAFTWWLAGGGVKAGHSHGETDDFSYNVVRDPVHIHDLNATLMHILGIDHERLTFHFQGRDFRLTDVHGRVITELLA